MGGGGDAEADGEWEIGGSAHGFDERADGCRERIPLAGYTGARNQIDEAGGVLRHQFDAPRGRSGRGQKDGVEAAGVHGLDVGCGLFHAGVGKQAAIDAGGRRVTGEAFQAIAQYRVEIGEEQQGNLGGGANLAGDLEHGGQGGAGLEGALAGALDDGAIGDGVAEGDAELDEIGAAADHGGHQGGGAERRRIAGGEIGDETFAVVALQGEEEAADACHSRSSSWKFSR